MNIIKYKENTGKIHESKASWGISWILFDGLLHLKSFTHNKNILSYIIKRTHTDNLQAAWIFCN